VEAGVLGRVCDFLLAMLMSCVMLVVVVIHDREKVLAHMLNKGSYS